MNTALALETVRTNTTPRERRESTRVQLQENVTVHVGRADGVLIDYSGGGARVRHIAALGVRTRIRVSFMIGVAQFHGTALVLSCRFIPQGASGMKFESRLSFVEVALEVQPRLSIVR